MSAPETEMLPCPFCGGQAYISEFSGITGTHFYAHCVDETCPAFIVEPYCGWSRKIEAIAAWNTRAPVASPAPDSEALAGYRAAAAYVAADSWDGCSDCIDALKAARSADYTNAQTADEIAENLKRIRKHRPFPEHSAPDSAEIGGLASLMGALACDCLNTDGWKDQA